VFPRDASLVWGGLRFLLQLKRVDIQGFKSFYDRTEMRFHGSGVTAIVGPNGCGKSNLSDAISWVLGEQSAKSLRGSRMEDVIFAGTRDRKPLGMAQVTLTMAEPREAVNGQDPRHPSEITITRRLYRSGESDYLIDGKTARLRDIQELFMGTGLGPESYAIIEQGRIGQILSNKPADRRAVIEEAAGIGKYKTRKRLAESKLESAKQNLARVFDILEEVGRQANSLKRQAAKAKRYEELRTDMLCHLRRAVAGRFRMLEGEAAKLALDLGQAQTDFQSLSAEVQSKEQEYARTQEYCYEVESALTESRARVAELNLESERTRSRLAMQAKQIAGIEERMAAGETETRQLDERQERESAELAAHHENLVVIEQNAAGARERLEAKSQERDALQHHLRERERSLESARQQVLRLLNEASALRNQLAQADEYHAAMERDAARARKEEEGASADIARLEHTRGELSSRLVARQMELESLTDRRRRVEDELKDRRQRTVEARQEVNALRDVLSKQKARKESLEGILSHRAYTTESVKRLFDPPTEGFRPLGVLADFVEVTNPEWERASEEFLHEELEYVVVQCWQDAERGIEIVRTASDGRATFLVHPESGGRSAAVPDLSSDPAVSGALRDAIRLTNGFAASPEGLLPRLSRCFLVADRSAASRLSEAYPDCYFLLPDGSNYHGQTISGGKKSSGGPLALKRELRELTAQVEIRDRETDQLTAELESLERGAALLSEELEQVRALQQAQEKDALALDHEQRKLAEEYARAGSRLSAARLELDRLARQDEQTRAQRERNHLLIAEKEQARFEQEKAVEIARGEFDGLQAQVHAIGEQYSVLRADLAGLEERARSEKTAAARIAAQMDQVAARRLQLSQDLERMGIERARLLADNIELDQRAQHLQEHTSEAAARVDLLTAQETGGREALTALDEALKSLRIAAQTAQEQRSHIELELVRKQSELKFLDETSRKELSAAANDIAAAEEPDAGSNITVEESEQRYEEVRIRIESLGPVNPQALEEFQEAQQRYEFLNTQRQDLLDSIRDTEKAIQELDSESRRRFKEAFENINSHFKEMFRTLFGGGQGEMRLTDESNLAESGIDIMASPPGKRLQHIALLSGGEKSLTAMSLLMAIFRYTPSPFCILDEVDAPLDEPNIQRLTRLIKEMSHDTQFIVITHAKRTMEAAQALYGVTMQEPGVSKLVSVKFDPLPSAAPAGATAALISV
jgi:chromosome segregation protein